MMPGWTQEKSSFQWPGSEGSAQKCSTDFQSAGCGSSGSTQDKQVCLSARVLPEAPGSSRLSVSPPRQDWAPWLALIWADGIPAVLCPSLS